MSEASTSEFSHPLKMELSMRTRRKAQKVDRMKVAVLWECNLGKSETVVSANRTRICRCCRGVKERFMRFGQERNAVHEVNEHTRGVDLCHIMQEKRTYSFVCIAEMEEI